VPIQSDRVGNPERLWIDLIGTRLHPNLEKRVFPVGDGLLEQVRIAKNRNDVVRVVLDFKEVWEHQVFYLENPTRLVIDVRGQSPGPESRSNERGRGRRTGRGPRAETGHGSFACARRLSGARRARNRAATAEPAGRQPRLEPGSALGCRARSQRALLRLRGARAARSTRCGAGDASAAASGREPCRLLQPRPAARGSAPAAS